ncbi:MAG: mobilization protein, partial [Bacteroidales bacterium]|nr:mobilization protein [Bacteroidales bacterium]
PVKSSSIGKMAGYEALERRMKRTTEKIKSRKLNIRQSKGIISNALNNFKNRRQFISILKDNRIDVVFRENEEKRIYGVTFIDHNNRSVFNGSRLGKEFSANAFDKLFGRSSFQSNDTEISVVSPEVQTSQGYPISVDEIFGTFYLDNSGYDAEEENFRRLLRRRKSKKNKL